MVEWSLKDYWALVQGHRRRKDESCLLGLRLMAHQEGRTADLATKYLSTA